MDEANLTPEIVKIFDDPPTSNHPNPITTTKAGTDLIIGIKGKKAILFLPATNRLCRNGKPVPLAKSLNRNKFFRFRSLDKFNI